MTADRPWWEDAACSGTADITGSLWDVEGGNSRDEVAVRDCRARAALAVCAVCPVIVQCDADAHKGRVVGVVMGGRVYGTPRYGYRAPLPTPVCAREGCRNGWAPREHGGRKLYCSDNCARLAKRARVARAS